MSGLCGWFCADRAGAAGPAAIATMAAAISRFDGSPVRSVSAGFGALAVAAGAPAAGSDLDIFQTGGQLVAVWGRARFTDAALADFAQAHGIAQALASGYAQTRARVFEALSGSFAVAILDGSTGEAVLAADRMGVRPLFYCVARDRLVFGSTLEAIDALPGGGSGIHQQALYNYVYFHMVPGPQSIRTGVRRMLPGEYLTFGGGKAETDRYWEMEFVENRQQPFGELKQKFLTVLRDSVGRAAKAGTVGTFLSGGTDSSTVAGLLGEVSGEPARTYSIGFQAEGYDEMEYARIAARHFGTRHHEYYVTPDDVAKAIPAIAAVFDQPFGNSSAVPTYYCAKLARDDGVDTLLGGDGGDELFGGNTRYARQRVFERYGRVPALLRKTLIEPLAFAVPGGEAILPVRKLRSYIRQANVPMPDRLETYNLLGRFGHQEVFTADFLHAIDPGEPIKLLRACYGAARAKTLINRNLALDFKFTLADNDLPKVNRACELAGVNVAYPLLDDAVVAFSASLAPGLKLKGNTLRYFFKEALRGFLPDAIITKQKHGFGLPFGPWLQKHKPLQDIVYGSLADLRKRDIVRPDFIDTLGKRVADHADYYGTMVWVLMMLEQWLQHHQDPRKPGGKPGTDPY